MSNPSTPFLWQGDARRAGGWPKAKESEANLRRYAPPPSKGRREKWQKNIYPLPMEGGCPKGGGWPKAKKSEANLRRYAPPPFRGRREKRDE